MRKAFSAWSKGVLLSIAAGFLLVTTACSTLIHSTSDYRYEAAHVIAYATLDTNVVLLAKYEKIQERPSPLLQGFAEPKMQAVGGAYVALWFGVAGANESPLFIKAVRMQTEQITQASQMFFPTAGLDRGVWCVTMLSTNLDQSTRFVTASLSDGLYKSSPLELENSRKTQWTLSRTEPYVFFWDNASGLRGVDLETGRRLDLGEVAGGFGRESGLTHFWLSDDLSWLVCKRSYATEDHIRLIQFTTREVRLRGTAEDFRGNAETLRMLCKYHGGTNAPATWRIQNWDGRTEHEVQLNNSLWYRSWDHRHGRILFNNLQDTLTETGRHPYRLWIWDYAEGHAYEVDLAPTLTAASRAMFQAMRSKVGIATVLR